MKLKVCMIISLSPFICCLRHCYSAHLKQYSLASTRSNKRIIERQCRLEAAGNIANLYCACDTHLTLLTSGLSSRRSRSIDGILTDLNRRIEMPRASGHYLLHNNFLTSRSYNFRAGLL